LLELAECDLVVLVLLKAAPGTWRRIGRLACFRVFACTDKLVAAALIAIVLRTVNNVLSVASFCAGARTPFKSEKALPSASKLVTGPEGLVFRAENS
jgi:hypothetical protein